MANTLILLGVVMIAIGLAWLPGERLGFGRLPGDIVIDRDGLRIYIPLMTSIIFSIVLTAIFRLFIR